MPTTKEITVYTLAELTGEARARAMDKLREWAVDHDWWEYTVEDAKRIGALLGLEDMDIQFSGFWSQGDGASFTGIYAYRPQSVRLIEKETCNSDPILRQIAVRLSRLQRTHGYKLTAVIERINQHYSHENTVRALSTHVLADNELNEILRSFMQWIYRALEQEYEYQTSDEQLVEMAKANEYTFDANGRRA
jgi:hypothetical protein